MGRIFSFVRSARFTANVDAQSGRNEIVWRGSYGFVDEPWLHRHRCDGHFVRVF